MSRKVVPLPKRAAAACRTREEETRWRGGFPGLLPRHKGRSHGSFYFSPLTPATPLGLIFLFHYLTSEFLAHAHATTQSSAARVSRDLCGCTPPEATSPMHQSARRSEARDNPWLGGSPPSFRVALIGSRIWRYTVRSAYVMVKRTGVLFVL